MAEALLFDLDGTLVDTAPTLTGIVNAMLAEYSLPPLPLAQARNLVSRGAQPLLARGFGDRLHAADSEALLQRFLELYEASTHHDSSIFIKIEDLFSAMSGNSLWGIVTNKPARLTEHLLNRLQLPLPPSCVVCGDTLDRKKPDPAPLLHAAALLDVDPAECIYVGDDARDVIAGRAAGMRTVIAAWGYIPPGTDFSVWGADGVAAHPRVLGEALGALAPSRTTQGMKHERS